MSHFSNDLGLDSLDTVEVVMAIEEVVQRSLSAETEVLTAYRSLVLRSRTRRPIRSTAVCPVYTQHC